jgi:preprotein translocase subunit SecD
MNQTIKDLMKDWRVIILVIFLILAVFAIHPTASEGVTVRSVLKDSAAYEAGMVSPKPNLPPVSKERIIAINQLPIKNIEDYENAISNLEANQAVFIQTDQDRYKVVTKYVTETITLNTTEWQTVKELTEVEEEIEINGTLVNKTINKTTNKTVLVNKTETLYHGMEPLGLSVYDAPKTNVRKGLDLQGGTRVILQPEEDLTAEEFDILISNMKQRLNVFGLSDLIIRKSGDLSGNQYIIVEIAGASEQEVKDLLAKQGKFEAKIANQTVFIGGRDITYVCRTSQCSGIDPNAGCGAVAGGQGYACRFVFSITLNPDAAERQADLTRDLEVITEDDDDFLSEKLELFLDDQKVDELRISASLRGEASTQIAISGSGAGPTEYDAVNDALQNMKRLQTILITGGLPVKLNVVKMDNIPPMLGKEFVNNSLFMGLMAILAVAVVVFIRYRKLQVAIPMIVTMTSEVLLLLGFAAIAGWNLDLAAIAGILIAVGTGVDHQIVIVDETISREEEYSSSWKTQLKKAFFIIFIAYLTTTFAMFPLIFAGAGLLRGFALTTIVGISLGVFITRPAFASIVRILLRR